MSFALLMIVAYTGLAVGVAIAHNAREELGTGGIYFKILKVSILATAAFLFLETIASTSIAALGTILVAIISMLWENYTIFRSDMLYYGLFAIFLYETTYRSAMTLLIFTFGIAAAGLRVPTLLHSWSYNYKRLLLENSVFILVGILLLLSF